MIFDTHTHLNDSCFDEDRDTLIKTLPDRQVSAFTEIGYDLQSSKRAIELARGLRGSDVSAYAAVGLHPDAARTVSDAVIAELRELAALSEVVAIGEIGLDYHYTDAASPDEQKRCFVSMLELARELSMPVVIHSRDAARDTYELIKEQEGYKNGGIVHCFSYSAELAAEFVKLGMYIGVGGVLTFSNGRRLKETVDRIPISSIVLETDCPYMAPVPHRGSRNEPGRLSYVAAEIARIKGMSFEEVVNVCRENAERVYRIKS